ncbi:WAT1-related protein At2g39510-like isoform X1 [Mangifera indica]|uniref:WAT1-related protein At2g39510-like isoform X1 n=1 Tax=Mangifera indica TaxID=29780 RepID=UPI001CF9ADD0|nr:WAT1-related protein At2g39510-like isoform X1 [Mangifera indica]
MIFLQFNLAFMSIIVKHALDKGPSSHVLVALRMIVAAIPISPFAMFIKRPVLFSQILYNTRMKYTSAKYTVAMRNIFPLMTFTMAWIFRLEIVRLRKLHSQAMILGTLLELSRTNGRTKIHKKSASDVKDTDLIKGAGCFCWSCFIILQAHILTSYPSVLTLAALVSILSFMEGLKLEFLVEQGNTNLVNVPPVCQAVSSDFCWNCVLLNLFHNGLVNEQKRCSFRVRDTFP